MKKKTTRYKEFFGPFCLHFYHNSYCDFPCVKGPFEFFEDAIDFAEKFDDDYYNLVRLGCWTDKNMMRGYYRLFPLNVQRRLF